MAIDWDEIIDKACAPLSDEVRLQRERAERAEAALRQERAALKAAEQRIATLAAALNRVLTEAGLQAHKHGCPNRLARPARWDEFAPCAGCQGEDALAPQPAQAR